MRVWTGDFRTARLPLAPKLPDDIFRGQIQINLRRGQPFMAEDILQRL